MIFTRDLDTPEAPVLLADGSWLVTEMGPKRACVTLLSPDGREKRVIAKTGRPNGLAIDRDGVIWVAETATQSLMRLTLDGETEKVATECAGEPFLWPNDVALGPDGAVYMTDSGILLDAMAPGGELDPGYEALTYDGRVYRIEPKTGAVQKIDAGFRFTNGIAFDADGNLYVTETMTGAIYRYKRRGGAVFGGREAFGNVIDPQAPEGLKGPDGMKFGADGCLYVAVYGQGDITVLGPDGAVRERIKTCGMLPSNLAFGAPGENRIYVTEDEKGVVEVFDVGTDGLPLYT